jgi:hypothetical protein
VSGLFCGLVLTSSPFQQTMEAKSGASFLIAAIADEDTVTGLLLSGIGQRDEKGQTNYLVVEPESKPKSRPSYRLPCSHRRDKA